MQDISEQVYEGKKRQHHKQNLGVRNKDHVPTQDSLRSFSPISHQ